MKSSPVKKWLFRGMVASVFAFILLIGFMLNPSLSYAHQSTIEGVKVYHNQKLDPELENIIRNSKARIKASQLYSDQINFQLCLKDGSNYPSMIETILGEDVIRSFSNINVVLAETDPTFHYLSWRGHVFRYDQFLAHVMVHNLQFHHHGLWGSNPLAGYPEWKWEGYADYVVLGKQYSLKELVLAYEATADDPYVFVQLQDDEGSLKLHIRFLILTKYCLDIRKLTYQEFMEKELDEGKLWEEISEHIR
ncbi:MAG: hypothetical protein AAGD28_23200, partial [Bacteroidota bacterium]